MAKASGPFNIVFPVVVREVETMKCPVNPEDLPRLRLLPWFHTEARRKPRNRLGYQRKRARAVLQRLFTNGYPDEDEVSTPDLLKRFKKEYARVEGQKKSALDPPSRNVILREAGRLPDE